MAGRVIRFFPRQAAAGNDSAGVAMYSPAFEVVGSDTLLVETQVYSADPATAAITVSIEETCDPTLADSSWTELGTASVTASAGVGRTKTTMSNPLRFVRAKYTVAADAYMMVAIEAIARSS